MKTYNTESTIVALSTPTGGALCVVRISGKAALEIIQNHTNQNLKPRTATLTDFKNNKGEIVDQIVATYYQAPKSFTGEDMVEISAHGSTWIANEIIAQCIESGAVAAGPGEFSQRAFLNEKIDLSQVEAIADLIASNSKAAAKIALNQLKGGYSKEFAVLREQLLKVLSLLELELDFGEEEVEFASRTELIEITEKILRKVRQLTESFKLGNVLKNGVAVAIVGVPNAGKSTLLNALVQEDRAIVSAEAGTTRDFIEAGVVIDGVLFRFIDTAGIREQAASAIEQQGIERSLEQLQKADIVLHLIDPTNSVDNTEKIEAHEGQTLLRVYTKGDIKPMDGGVSISAKTGRGIDELKSQLRATVDSDNTQETVVSNARHYTALINSTQYLERAIEGLQNALPAELVSSELRCGMQFIEEITGEITSENILHSIFANHCIGK